VASSNGIGKVFLSITYREWRSVRQNHGSLQNTGTSQECWRGVRRQRFVRGSSVAYAVNDTLLVPPVSPSISSPAVDAPRGLTTFWRLLIAQDRTPPYMRGIGNVAKIAASREAWEPCAAGMRSNPAGWSVGPGGSHFVGGHHTSPSVPVSIPRELRSTIISGMASSPGPSPVLCPE
jgi:hypothetical protein